MIQKEVKIIKVDYFGDEEAEVLFEVNNHQYWAFSHPCDLVEGEIIQAVLFKMVGNLPEEVFWNQNKENRQELVPIEHKNVKWMYDVYGCIKSINPIMIDCGDFIFPWGEKYGDNYINQESSIGRYVYFQIIRLDIERAESYLHDSP